MYTFIMHLGGICSTVQMSKETHYLMLYLKAHYPKAHDRFQLSRVIVYQLYRYNDLVT